MKLEIGKPDYPYDHAIKEAVLRGRLPNKPVPLYVVTIAEMESLHERLPELRGCPSYVAFDAATKRVWLHPLPNGEYHLDIVPDESPEIVLVVPDTPPPPDHQTGRFAGKITKAVAEAFGKKL